VANPDFLAVGHLCCDIIDGRRILGGSASYASLTAKKLGWKTGILTAIADDFPFLELLQDISIHTIHSPSTTTFRNIYHNGSREQFISSIARSIGPSDIPERWLEAQIVYLCPIANEVIPETAACFQASLVGVGAQGWFRKWDQAGRVYKTAWKSAISVAKAADVIVYSELDTDGPYELAEELVRYCPIVVVTQSSKGADLFTDGKRIHVPAFEIEEIDPTGAGDVFAASFLIQYQDLRDPISSAKFACCAASFVCEKEGTEGIPTLEQVHERLRQYDEVYSASLL
jgi:1D-myo-inositol 3-kinase